jgi:hypothetical protein
MRLCDEKGADNIAIRIGNLSRSWINGAQAERMLNCIAGEQPKLYSSTNSNG